MPALVIVDIEVTDPARYEAKAWRESPEYAEAKKVRETCARSNMVVVEGVG
jgi:uncharacterized protein (DUF1330 family)